MEYEIKTRIVVAYFEWIPSGQSFPACLVNACRKGCVCVAYGLQGRRSQSPLAATTRGIAEAFNLRRSVAYILHVRHHGPSMTAEPCCDTLFIRSDRSWSNGYFQLRPAPSVVI